MFGGYFGAVAQLGERLTGSQEARGSSPLSSTNIAIKQAGYRRRWPACFCFGPEREKVVKTHLNIRISVQDRGLALF